MEDRSQTEEELVAMAKAGDTRSYDQLVVRYQDLAVRTAYLIAGPDAEDAAQEGFVKAFYSLGRFRTGSPFRPWILRIVANEARNRAKSTRRRAALSIRLAHTDNPSQTSPSPEEAILEHDFRMRLLGALGRLKERDKLLIGYRYLLDLSESEAAAILGVPRGTVKSRLSRALDRLRAELGPRDDAPNAEEAVPRDG